MKDVKNNPFLLILMIKKKYFFILLYCLFSTSTYGEGLTDYTWQQESASCLININCIPPDNDARKKRKKCLQLPEHEEEKNKLIVIGDSCAAAQKNTQDNTSGTLSALFTSVKKSLSKFAPDLKSTEAIDVAVFYITINKVVKNKETIDNNSTEQQKTDIVPVLLVRFKKDLYFDFNSSELKETGSAITRHIVHDVLTRTTVYKNITVVGHADSVGTEKDNVLLSKKRSDVTVAELQKQISTAGDSANVFQIGSMGVGETHPIDHLKQGKKSHENRRLEIFMSASSIALHRAEKYLQCLYRNKSNDEPNQTDCFIQYMTVQTQ
jgi:outer membrane protein OmpA-like peptidoglycan-associated protein